MLGLVGNGGPAANAVEEAVYDPGVQQSGDLEAGTHTVSATAMGGTADYTTALTVPAPADARLVVCRLGLRLQVVIDSLAGGATTVHYAVKVAGTQRLTGTWSATGTQAAAADLPEGEFTVGAAQTMQVYLWVDAGTAVVSACVLACGVGSCATTSPAVLPALCVKHRGLAHLRFVPLHVGTGSATVTLNDPGFTGGATPMYAQAAGDWSRGEKLALVVDPVLACNGTVATDINVLNWLRVTFWAPGD